MHTHRTLLLTLIALSGLSGLTGCSGRVLKSLDTKYEHTRLPAHADKNVDKDDRYLSIGVSRSQQQTVAFKDSAENPWSFRNAGTSVDGSFLFERGALHFGAQFGFSPGEDGLIRAGGFGGASTTLGSFLVPSFSAGLFLNINRNKGRYDEIEWIWIFPTVTTDSSDGTVSHLEVPLRANLLFDTHTPVSPYLSGSANIIGVGVQDASINLIVVELTAGVLLEFSGGHGFRFEASTTSQAMPDKEAATGDVTGKPLWGARVEYVKKI